MSMPNLSARMVRTLLFKRDGNHCVYCNVTLSHKTATIDHVIPLAKGGSRKSFSNLLLCCEPCNREKANQSMREFLKARKEETEIKKAAQTGKVSQAA